MEKAREHQQPLYMCFIDFQKAFDYVPHNKLFFTMFDMDFPPHVVDLLINLYKSQRAKVKVAGTMSDWLRIRRGVRQGCVLSPYLFNIFAEMAMRTALEDFDGGLRIGGRCIKFKIR